jgi:hypothetical protein
MSKVLRVTVDSWGNIYPIVSMLDRYAHDTEDPALAVACIVNLGQVLQSASCDDVPIYTVH